jgi:hypothetical protein
MITHRKIAWASVLTASVFLVWWQARADERPARPLPEWVRSLVAKHFPDAELKGGHREGDEDEQRYELTLKRDGLPMSTDVTADAGVVSIDEDLRHEQVPEKVMKSFRRAFPKGEIKRSEKSTDIRVTYHIEVVTDGRKREVTLSPRGKILEIEKRD